MHDILTNPFVVHVEKEHCHTAKAWQRRGWNNQEAEEGNTGQRTGEKQRGEREEKYRLFCHISLTAEKCHGLSG